MSKGGRAFFVVFSILGLLALIMSAVYRFCIYGIDKKEGQAISSDDIVITIKSVSFVMKPVEGGTFQMGSENNDGIADDDEKPTHSVTVSSFYISEIEVTQGLWEAVMGTTVIYQRNLVNSSSPLRGLGADLPMYYVNWYECQEFIRRLNSQTGKCFRLPTEAEWEYASKGGNKRNDFKYAGSNSLANVAWYSDNSNSSSHPVKSKTPNAIGLFDMSGNVWEWCQDWYGYYNNNIETNPIGPADGSKRVVRGGSWYSNSSYCRVTKRYKIDPGYRDTCYGFRLVLDSSK